MSDDIHLDRARHNARVWKAERDRLLDAIRRHRAEVVDNYPDGNFPNGAYCAADERLWSVLAVPVADRSTG